MSPRGNAEMMGSPAADSPVGAPGVHPADRLALPDAHLLPAADVLARLGVDTDRGLNAIEATRRLKAAGPNLLREARPRSVWAILFNQFKSVLTLLLAAAAGMSFAFGDVVEAIAIAVVILLNGAIGFGAERRAVRSIEALRRLGSMTTRVRRGGTVLSVAAEELVPGDVVLISGGDVVTADVRLVEANALQCDESTLTGESVPVAKSTGPVEAAAPLSDRTNMAFKGTAVTRGSAIGVVVATGMRTELGQISELVAGAHGEASPLEKRLQRLSEQMLWAALGVIVVITLLGVVAGREPLLMIKTGIALAVAAVPEGLPIVATLALARGMWRLAQRNALIERLSAVETLGAVTVVFTDKTGTLTENRMAVTDIKLSAGLVHLDAGAGTRSQAVPDPGGAAADPAFAAAMRVCALCNEVDMSAPDGQAADPMELALIDAAERTGFNRLRLANQHIKVATTPFDPEVRMMATVHENEEAYLYAVKGAPEAVLAHAALDEADRRAWLDENTALAAQGLRVLAVAEKRTDTPDADPYTDLAILGLIGLKDPPRPDARPAVEATRRAGIRVVMLTGDNAVTGANIAQAVGLTDDHEAAAIEGRMLKPLEDLSEADEARLLAARVFARVSPRQKLDLIALQQRRGEIVAMTGDGVNDAPALKKADIGIAMGLRGTQVAKEAADMILKDDAFASIVAAIRQGRVIFSNIRKFVIYLLSCNLSEVLVVALGTISGLPLPLLPLQILFLNLVTDVFPALALGAGGGERDVLDHPPRRPDEPIMTRRHWRAVVLFGLMITIAVLSAFIWALNQPDQPPEFAVTVAFLTLAFAQLWHVFNMRSRRAGLINNQVVRNPYVWTALVLCSGVIMAAVYWPPLAEVLQLVVPDAQSWAVIVSLSLLPLAVGQVAKFIRHSA